jgi:GT2 family glycosyltransferase
VTGAFMSFDRAWFERLGGFSPEFIFGHYEDVDLCLRSLQAGTPAWLHDIPFWHLESAGGKRGPIHNAARLVNRWHLTAKWGGLVKTELNGRSPIRFGK